MKNRLPKSLRKFLRSEKSRLRREFFHTPEAEEKIKGLANSLKEEYKKNRTK